MAAAKRHNKRIGNPSSQIKKSELWFLERGHISFIDWNVERVAKARSLMTRKDAIVGLEFVVQIGNQNDYRDSDDVPKKTTSGGGIFGAELLKTKDALVAWATQKFGADNIVSLDFHADESTPHFHLVVSAIDNTPAPAPHPNAKNKKRPDDRERLNVKRWMSNRVSILELRKSCHAYVNNAFSCEYSSDIPDGGHPHDPTKSVAVGSELKRLQAENAELKEQLNQAQEKINDLMREKNVEDLNNLILKLRRPS